MELSNSGNAVAAGFSEPLFDWAPDAERLEREVCNAEVKGRCDDLTLAEIGCSIDLLESEISGLRKRAATDPRMKILADIRSRLAALAVRLERLPG